MENALMQFVLKQLCKNDNGAECRLLVSIFGELKLTEVVCNDERNV